MKVFITGANGFIGSNICRRFLARGWDVAGLVRPAADRAAEIVLEELGRSAVSR